MRTSIEQNPLWPKLVGWHTEAVRYGHQRDLTRESLMRVEEATALLYGKNLRQGPLPPESQGLLQELDRTLVLFKNFQRLAS